MIRPTDYKNYLISGVFVSLLVLLSMITIFMLNKENPVFGKNIQILTEVKNAQNLKDGAAVQLRGIKVGRVSEIKFKSLDSLVIELSVNDKYRKWIRKDSSISFKTQGVLGDKFLEISGGDENIAPIEDGDYLKINEINTFDQIITKSEDLIALAGNVLNKVDKILSSAEGDKLEKIISNIDSFTSNANKFTMSLNDKNLNRVFANLNTSTQKVEKLLTRIENGPGSLHALIYDQALHEDLRSLVGGANRNKVLKFFIRESIKKNDTNK